MTQEEVLEVDILICGAGVVGLAIAMTLAKKYSVAVVEQHPGPARETSSHNSGVIHAGIYYETGSFYYMNLLLVNQYMWILLCYLL